MKQRKPSKVENDLHETGIFVFLTLIIFFGAVGFPTLINTSPSFGYEGIEFTPVTTAWQEAYAEQQVMETLALYNYNPLLYSAWLVMPNMLDNPPDFTTLLANSYTNNKWNIETGILEFETFKELFSPETYFPSAYADHIVDTTGLEIYWKFDETSGGFKNSNITNIFPDGNSTTETGTFLKSETGIIGTAWKSPASGNTIKVLTGGTPSDYDFMVDGNSTFNMWIKDDSCSVGGFAIQWTTFDNSIADGANTQTESCGTNDIMRVRYFESVGNDNVEEVSPNGYYESDANTFDMYTVVHDNTNDLLLWFKNGVLLATNTTSNDDMSGVVTDNTPILWNSADFNVAYNNGTFDEFSFWSRALSTTDVTSLYNSGLGLELENQTLAPIFDQTITDAVPVVDEVTVTKVLDTTDLEAYWKFEETSGNMTTEAFVNIPDANSISDQSVTKSNTGIIGNGWRTADGGSPKTIIGGTASDWLFVSRGNTTYNWWMQSPDPAHASDTGYLFASNDFLTADFSGDQMFMSGGGSSVTYDVFDGGSLVVGESAGIVDVSCRPNCTSFSMYTVSKNLTSGQVLWYRNATLIATDSGASAGTTFPHFTPIQLFGRTNLDFFGANKATFDEWSIWSRVLTPLEITVLFNNTNGFELSGVATLNQAITDTAIVNDDVTTEFIPAPIFNVTITDTVTAKDREDSIVNLMSFPFELSSSVILMGSDPDRQTFDGYIGNQYNSSEIFPQTQPIKVKGVYVTFMFGNSTDPTTVADTGTMTAVVLQNVTLGGSQSDVVTIAESDAFDLTVQHNYTIRPPRTNGGNFEESVVFNFTGTDVTLQENSFIGFRLENVDINSTGFNTKFVFETYRGLDDNSNPLPKFNGEGRCLSVNSTDTFGLCSGTASPDGAPLGIEIGILVEDTSTFTTTGGIAPDKLIIHHTFDSETLYDSAYPETLFKNAGTLQELGDISVLNNFGVQTNQTRSTGAGNPSGLMGEAGYVGGAEDQSNDGFGFYEIGFSDINRAESFTFFTNNENLTDTWSINMWINGNFSDADQDYVPLISIANTDGDNSFVLGATLSDEITFQIFNNDQEVMASEITSETFSEGTWEMITMITEKTNSTDAVIICVNNVCESFPRGNAWDEDQTILDNRLLIGDFLDRNFDAFDLANSGFGNAFLIDELCIWKDYKLTPADVATMYNSDDGLPCGTVTETSGGLNVTFIAGSQTFNQTETDTATVSDQITVNKFIVDTTDLETYWKFEETTARLFNSNITNIFPDGNSTSETNINKTFAGIIGNAWITNATGNNQNVKIGGTASDWDFFIDDSNNSTINLWIRDDGCTTNTNWIIETRQNFPQGEGIELLVDGCQAGIDQLRTIYIGTLGSVNELSPLGSYGANENTWDMYTVVHDNTNDLVHWYKNGTLVETDATDGTALGGTSDHTPTLFNAGFVNNQPYLNTAFDEWSIWSRALSGSEVTSLYNNGFGLELENQVVVIPIINNTDTVTVSDEVNATKITVPAPDPIQNLALSHDNINTEIDLTWDVSANADNYTVQRLSTERQIVKSDSFGVESNFATSTSNTNDILGDGSGFATFDIPTQTELRTARFDFQDPTGGQVVYGYWLNVISGGTNQIEPDVQGEVNQTGFMVSHGTRPAKDCSKLQTDYEQDGWTQRPTGKWYDGNCQVEQRYLGTQLKNLTVAETANAEVTGVFRKEHTSGEGFVVLRPFSGGGSGWVFQDSAPNKWFTTVGIEQKSQIMNQTFINITTTSNNFYSDDTANNYNSYFYRIVPLNGALEGDPSSIVNGTLSLPPLRVPDLNATDNGASVDLEWAEAQIKKSRELSEDPVQGYIIQRATGGNETIIYDGLSHDVEEFILDGTGLTTDTLNQVSSDRTHAGQQLNITEAVNITRIVVKVGCFRCGSFNVEPDISGSIHFLNGTQISRSINPRIATNNDLGSSPSDEGFVNWIFSPPVHLEPDEYVFGYQQAGSRTCVGGACATTGGRYMQVFFEETGVGGGSSGWAVGEDQGASFTTNPINGTRDKDYAMQIFAETTWDTIGTNLGATNTTFTDNSPPQNVTKAYRVLAFNDAGVSHQPTLLHNPQNTTVVGMGIPQNDFFRENAQGVLTAGTLNYGEMVTFEFIQLEIPDPITTLTATQTNSVFLNWTAPNGTITGYKIQRNEGNSSVFDGGATDLIRGAHLARSAEIAGTFDRGAIAQRFTTPEAIVVTGIQVQARCVGGCIDDNQFFAGIWNDTGSAWLANSTNFYTPNQITSVQNVLAWNFDPPVELFSGQDVTVGIWGENASGSDIRAFKWSAGNKILGSLYSSTTTLPPSFGAVSDDEMGIDVAIEGWKTIVADTGTTVTNFTDTTCPEGMTCFYNAIALNGVLESEDSNLVNATEGFVSGSELFDSSGTVWQYREYDDAGALSPKVGFDTVSGGALLIEMDIGDSCCFGNDPRSPNSNGLVFKVFPLANITGSSITVNMKGESPDSPNGFQGVYIRVLDGGYLHNDYFQIAQRSFNFTGIGTNEEGLLTKGEGILGSLLTEDTFLVQDITLDSSSIAWTNATQDEVTIVLKFEDTSDVVGQTWTINNVTISEIGIWDFENGTAVFPVVGSAGGAGAIQENTDSGFYNNTLGFSTLQNVNQTDTVIVSDEVTATFIPATPDPVTGLTAIFNETSQSIDLSWDATPNADSFRIYRTSTESGDLETFYSQSGSGSNFALSSGQVDNRDSIAQSGDHFAGWTAGQVEGKIFSDLSFDCERVGDSTNQTALGQIRGALFIDAMLSTSNTDAKHANSTNFVEVSTLGNVTFATETFQFRGTDLYNLTASDNAKFGWGLERTYLTPSTDTVRCARSSTDSSIGGGRFWNAHTNPQVWTWSNPSDLDSVAKFINNTKLSADPEVDDTASTATTFSDTNIDEAPIDIGNTYFYRIVGLNAIQEQGDFSSVVNATALNTTAIFDQTEIDTAIVNDAVSTELLSVPDQVTGLTVIQNMNNNATLNWDDASGADNYEVFRDLNVEDNIWQFREVKWSAGSSTTIVHSVSSSSANMAEAITSKVGTGIIFKNFTNAFLNNSRIIVDWQGGSDSGFSGTTANLQVYNHAYNRDNFSEIPTPSTAPPDQALHTEKVTFARPYIGNPQAFARTFDSVDWINNATTDGFSTIFVNIRDASTSIRPNVQLFSVNITDITTNETKAFYPFGSSFGTTITQETSPEQDQYGFYNVTGATVGSGLIGSPVASEFTDTTIGQTQVVNYTVRAVNTNGNGDFSDDVEFGLIQPIAGLTANSTNSTTIKLSWNEASTVHPSDPLTGVIIQRSNATGFEIQEWELKEQDRYEGGFCFSEPSFIVEYQSGVLSSAGLFIINNSLAVAQGNADTAEDLLKLQHAHPDAVCPQGKADPSRGDFYLYKVFDKADLPQTGNVTVTWGGFDNYFVCETAFPLACVSVVSSRSPQLQIRDGVLDRFNSTDFPANPATPTATGSGVPLKGAGILASIVDGKFQQFSGTPPFSAYIHTNTTSYDLSSSTLDNVTLNIFIDDSSAFLSPTILLESIEIEDFGIWDFQRKTGTDKLGNGIINYTADLQQNGLDGMDDGSMIAQFTCTKTVGDCDFGASVSLQGTGESNFTTITTVDELDTMFNDTGLDENTLYLYRAKGESAVSTGAFDLIANATTTILALPIFNQSAIDTATVSDQTDVTAVISQFVSDIVTAIDNLVATTGKSSSDTATTSDQQIITSPPFPITTLSASTVGNTCELSWSAPPNGNSPIIKYQIFRSVSSGAFSLLLNQTFVNHTDTGLINNVLYEYNVTSINAFGDSEQSNIENCMPIVSTVPNAPSLTDVNEEPNGDVTIDWIASTEGSPTGYKIERKVGGGGFLVLVANTGNSLVTFTDTTTSPATQFTYRISGINAFGTGAPSNEGSITTASPPNAPLLSGEQNGDQIDISWTTPASANPITGYKIDRRINFGAFTTLIANTTTTDLNFTDANVTKPDSFGYRVRALSSAGEGTVSNVVDITFGSHLIVKVREQDSSFFKGGGVVKGVNSTFTLLVGLDVNSNAIFDNLAVGNFNFTFTDADDFILNKTFNILAPAGNDTSEFTINALVFDVDCPTNGLGTDIRIKVNYTDAKDIAEFPSTPVCDSTDQVSWSTRWQGDAVNDTSTMVADFISTIFKANAETFLASAETIPTSYNSGLNKITSETYVVNMTDTTINFNLFLGRAPAGGGGGGSGSQPTPQITIPDPEIVFAQRLTGLSLLSRTHQFAQAGQVIEGSITVVWEGEDNLSVKEVILPDSELDIRFDLTPFPLNQVIEGTGEFAMSSAEIPYQIVLPPSECSPELGITINCFDPVLHTLPVEFRFGLGDQEYVASTEVFVDGRPIPLDIVQLQIILLFLVLIASAVFGNFIRRRVKGGKRRQVRVKKKFKKKFDAS